MLLVLGCQSSPARLADAPRVYVAGQPAVPPVIDGRLDDDIAGGLVQEVVAAAPKFGVRVLGQVRSPIRGGKSSRKSGVGNAEFLLLLEPLDEG